LDKSVANFNWVEARHACSLSEIFHTLKEVLKSDVASANGLKIQDVKFSCKTDATNKIIVGRSEVFPSGIAHGREIIFELLPAEIKVKEGRTDKHLFSAVPNLIDNGECLLEIDGRPYQFWQVSRKALEDLFFGG
jgi:hypothetical protein